MALAACICFRLPSILLAALSLVRCSAKKEPRTRFSHPSALEQGTSDAVLKRNHERGFHTLALGQGGEHRDARDGRDHHPRRRRPPASTQVDAGNDLPVTWKGLLFRRVSSPFTPLDR